MKVLLRKATEQDYAFFYRLLIERDNAVNINDNPIPTRQQSDVYNATVNLLYDYVILLNGMPVGRISVEDGKEKTIGIFISKQFQGNGIGTNALKMLLKKFKNEPLYAYISYKNINSMRFFEKNGFSINYVVYKR